MTGCRTLRAGSCALTPGWPSLCGSVSCKGWAALLFFRGRWRKNVDPRQVLLYVQSQGRRNGSTQSGKMPAPGELLWQ
jgi:hypothetical protein